VTWYGYDVRVIMGKMSMKRGGLVFLGVVKSDNIYVRMKSSERDAM